MAGAAGSMGRIKGEGGGATASGVVGGGQIGQAAQVAGKAIGERLVDALAGHIAVTGGEGTLAQPATLSMKEAIKPTTYRGELIDKCIKDRAKIMK